MTSPRKGVIWFGRQPSRETDVACVDRGLLLLVGQTTTSEAAWAAARGVVFALSADEDGRALETRWRMELRRALSHGLKVVVLTDLAHVASVNYYVKTINRTLEPWGHNREPQVAEEVARHDPGPAWSNMVAVDGDDQLGDEDKLLLRRAFGDCISVKLVPQLGGRSARVFCAYARLRDSRAGPLPLPFFVKLDKRTKIVRELDNYRECTTLFIPFNQRPNLAVDRCAVGIDRGIIVGNFIEESVPLRELVEAGTARHAINSLFNSALRGWRSQAYHDAANTVNASLVTTLGHCMPSMYPPRRRANLVANAEAAMALGATSLPDELETLLRQLPAIPHRCALMHGDLHGDNVRVHATEAILIDFTSVSRGPLVADPAALDVALVMGTYALEGDAWLRFVQECYALDCLCPVPPPADPAAPAAALWNSVRLIRQVGQVDQLSPFEYATAVALYLLRRASYTAEHDEDPVRRATAYLLAEHIIFALNRQTAINLKSYAVLAATAI